MPKAYLYIRYSTAEQADGDSHDRQIRLATAFVQSRPDLGLEIVGDPVFVDAGVSSFLGGNLAPDKALGKFIAAVDSGDIPKGSALLVESLDRLSRQEILLAQRVFLDILNRGITIIATSPTEKKVYDGQAGLIDLILMLTHMERAHAESALKSRRVKDAWTIKRRKAQDGTIITRVCPNWLSVSEDGKSFEIIEERAKIVQTIFSLAETMGYQSIARYLNESGIPPFSAKSRGWQSSNIVKLLLSPAVIGTYQPRSIEHVRTDTGIVRRTKPEGLPIEGYYPPVISRATFDRIQLLKSARTKKQAGRKGHAVRNLFSHVAICGLCESNMVLVQKGKGTRGAKGGTHLVCSIARRGAGCKYLSWPYESLESSFLDYCENIDLSELVPQATADQTLVDLRKNSEELTGQLRSANATIERLTNDIAENGGKLPQRVQQFLVQRETEVQELDLRIAELRVKIAEEEHRRRERQRFSEMFADVKSRLATTTGPALFRLRLALQKAIRYSVLTMKLYHTSPTLSEQLRLTWPTLPPKITHHYHIVFRVGVVRAIYFSRRKPVLLLDNEGAANGTMNGTIIPISVEPHHSIRTSRKSDGKWTKNTTDEG